MNQLPSLPYDAWEATRWTLQLYLQIIGKIRLAATAHQNHWWNVTLYVNVRGLTTGTIYAHDDPFSIDVDFIDDVVIIRRSNGAERPIALRDGLSVREFYFEVMGLLEALELPVRIWAKPYGIPIETRFDEDSDHRSYDSESVRRWWRILLWSSEVFQIYAARFAGKQSPVHLFWHTLDLAVARYNGRSAPARPNAGIVEREAYSREVIAAGFWPGDAETRFPAYYTYTAPEPESLASQLLAPLSANWVKTPAGSHLGVLAYDGVRDADDPRETLLSFLQSGYDAGANAAAWDVDSLRSSFDDAAALLH